MSNKNGIILYRSWAAGRSITVSSEDGDLVGSNLVNGQPGETWRSDEAGDPMISGDFGERRPCNAVCLANHNLTTDDTVTLELADDAAFTVDLVEHSWPGLLPAYGYGEQPWDLGPVGGESDDVFNPPLLAETFDLVVRRYHRVTIERASGDTEIGEYMIGQTFQPAVNFDWGLDIGWTPATEQVLMRDGSIRPADMRDPYREGSITWSWFEYADARRWFDMVRRIGKDRPVLFIPYPTEETTLAREQTILAWIREVSRPRQTRVGHSVTVHLREAL